MASKCLPVSRRRSRREDEPIFFYDIQSMDATEYLSRVVQQSNRLPEILCDKNRHQETPSTIAAVSTTPQQYSSYVPIEGSAASLSYLVSFRTAILPPPTANHVPPNAAQWVEQTLTNFAQLRDYLEKLYQQKGGRPERNKPVPPMKDRPGWHIFCLGVQEARGNAGSYFADEDDDDNEEGNAEKEIKHKAAEAWRQDLPETGYAPSTSLVLQLDQVMLRHVIAHLEHYVQEGWYSCSAKRSQWLYCLLARLEKPVHRNDAAVLCSLLKCLTKARANSLDLASTKGQEGLARLNLLIVVIGIYFEYGGGYAGCMEAK